MIATVRPSSDPLDRALAWTAARGVRVEAVSSSSIELDRELPDHPVLYLVEPGVTPPFRWGELEDWVRLPAVADEVYDRVERLLARADHVGASVVYVDDDEVLRIGLRSIPLSPLDAVLVRVLLAAAGRIVTRGDLERRLWPDRQPPEHRALDNRVKRLRQRLRGLPLEIHTVRGRGLLLDRPARGGHLR